MRDYAMIYKLLCEDLRPLVKLRSHTGFAARQQLRNFYKKLSPTRTISKEASDLALKKFKSINESISLKFEFGSENDRDSVFWMYLKRYISESLEPLWSDDAENLDVLTAVKWIGLGPGSSVGVNSESFYTKLFDGHLTATDPYCLALYRAIICETGAWAMAEKARSEKFGLDVVKGNTLFFVPKNSEVARTCCTEPVINMALQKAIGGYIERRLAKFFGISLDTQPDFNRALCRQGSLNGSFGTIDLKSASDSISWDLVQQLFPANVVSWLQVARSPSSRLPDGSWVDLKMISTMGNGFTFPLQTLLFAAVVRSVYHLYGLPCKCPRTQFGVFGDDIIVARECYDDVIRYLTKLGFQVNADKSFNTGPFRESCGHDYYSGAPVRSVYISSLETTSDVYSAINRLVRWSTVQGIDIPLTVKYLIGLVRMRPIPYQESDDAGIKVPLHLSRSLGALGNNYQKLMRITKKRSTAETPEQAFKLGYKDFNPDGWLVTCVGGYARSGASGSNGGAPLKGALEISNGFLTLRDPPDSVGRYRVTRGRVPFWDFHGYHADGVRHSEWDTTMSGYLTD